jgi:P4 family phage/plasmid primase-like protien
MLTLIGRTGCGKSTLLDAWGYVVGDMMMEKKLTELQGDSMRFAGAQFIGKRLCWFDEVDVKRAEMGNTLGTLVTGQHINVERKGVNGIVKARNTLKCVLTANRLPLSAEIGIFRRLILVPIKVSFSESGVEDKEIHDKLQAEACGILNRMIRGLHDLKKMGGFTLIEGHEDLIEDYKASSDTVAEFLDEYLEPGTIEDTIPSKVLYNTYQKYTEGNSFTRSMSPSKFGQLLASQPLTRFAHIESKKVMIGKIWTGLRVKDDYKLNSITEILEAVSEGNF